ncbi:MAG: PHP domain-containing protein [Nitrosomonadales bacterium]|nr:PHP domain-containing protein [Nitrosomonadales bacterium]
MNIPIIDLHCHSNVSDGLLSPAELMSHAAENNVQAIALTDHDDIAGLSEASFTAKSLNIIFINGVEISVTWKKRTLHIVGLNFDKDNKLLFQGLKKIRDGRYKRAQLMADGLGMAGIQGAMDGAKSYAKNSTIGRIHFAQFLVAQGYAKDISAVFKKFLTPGKPGYVDHEWISLEESIRLINGAGGDAIIAHPGRYDMGNKLYPKLFQEFKDLGGTGVEVMSGSQDPSQANYFSKLAANYNLFSSCGSDFHGKGISHRALGNVRSLPNDSIPIWTKWDQIKKLFH